MARYVKLALLCAIANGTTMDCSAQNLVTQAQCFENCISSGMADAIEIYLLCQIAANGTGGGGGGTGSVLCAAAADPVAAPSGTCGIYYRLDNGKVWIWNSGAAAWNQILG